MENPHAVHNAIVGVREDAAAMVRMIMHPRDLQRPEDLHVPEHIGIPVSRVISPRAASCTGSDGFCDKPVQQSAYTLPVVLGIAGPIVVVVIAAFFLHRRYQRRQRMEDANDPYKSLDFGLTDGPRGGGKKVTLKGTENSTLSGIDLDEKPAGLRRQLSMDMISPYLLPPELQQSRESLHSLSRTIHQQEDPYRPVSQFVADTSRAGTPTGMRPRHDGSSIHTSSSAAPSRMRDNYTAELLPNVADIARTPSPLSGKKSVPPPRLNSLPQRNGSASSSESHLDPIPQLPRSPLDQISSLQMPAPVAQIPSKNPTTGLGSAKGLPANPRPAPAPAPLPAPVESIQDAHSDTSSSPPRLNSFRFSDDSGSRHQHSKETSGSSLHPFDLDSSPPPALPAKSPDRVAFPFEDSIGPPSSIRESPPPLPNSLPANPRPERKKSLAESHVVEEKQLPKLAEPQQAWLDDTNDYDQGFKVTPPSPGRDEARMSHRYSMDVPPEEFANAGLGAPGFDARRLSMGFRPLPPNEVTETDDPEVRANRIRSFYKEYFDESKPAPQGQYYEDYDAHYHQVQPNVRYNNQEYANQGHNNNQGYNEYHGYNHDQGYNNNNNNNNQEMYANGGYDEGNYYDEGGYYQEQDQGQGHFVQPYAQPIGRRAMTPPPQGSRFMGRAQPRHGSMGGMSMSGMSVGGRSMAGSMMSGPRFPKPRSSSSASGRMGPPRGRPLPPPAALNSLPTPSKLKDDSFALMGAIDFAPPMSYKERVAGRSESPLGERRPYSPSVPAYKPIASAYEELSSVPSPYILRKSGTFTGLDFAPPRKFRDADNMSDAGSIRGSIRSNRSGVSAVHDEAIRRGAYRVSRLPGDQVFTKNDLSTVLKPQWGMRQGS